MDWFEIALIILIIILLSNGVNIFYKKEHEENKYENPALIDLLY
jgi:hypothetical protein